MKCSCDNIMEMALLRNDDCYTLVCTMRWEIRYGVQDISEETAACHSCSPAAHAFLLYIGKYSVGAATLLDSSSWVPLFQASEKMELTMLWDRTWQEARESDSPLSDWLEWLDWDSV